MLNAIQINSRSVSTVKRLRVAAYARVSEECDRLIHSLNAQVSYYTELIQCNPMWEFVGVYADKAITGTLTSKRLEFQKMIKDCEEGKIDIILTKSIQRFSRNTLDLLETVRHLKSIGVEVWFEKEHINTMDSAGELMITILASFAQDEIRNLSENVRWNKRMKMEKGEISSRVKITGYSWEGAELIVECDEADVIKRIFSEYIAGKSPAYLLR